MNVGKIFTVVLLGLLLWGKVGKTAENEVMRPTGIKGNFISKPIMIKQLYREAWQQDNGAQMSLTEQLEYFQEHNPGFDDATLNIMRRGTEMLKKMDMGLDKKDLTEKAEQIKKNPTVALEDFLITDDSELKESDALEAVDIMDSAQELMEKVYQNRSLNKPTYQININSF